MELKKYTRLSLLLSLSVVLNIMESFIPFFSGTIPGLKIGLANIVIVFVLYFYSFKEAIFLSLLRVVLVGILRTGLFSITFFFSLSGSLLSILAMALFKKTKLSIMGVSTIGSVTHSIGQVLISIIILDTVKMIYYLPYLLLLSIPTGLITGYISKELVKLCQKRLNN